MPNYRARFAILAAVTAAVMVYGSLYPFHFHTGPPITGAVRTLLSTYSDRTSRSDALANILLYIPLGFCLATALASRGRILRAILVAPAGVALSFACELAQVYDTGRDPAMTDVYFNSLGTVLGLVAAAVIRARPGAERARGAIAYPFIPVLLIFFWLGYRLYPFVPATDIYKYWLAVKPLVREPDLRLVDLYRHTVIWLALAFLIERLIGKPRALQAFFLFVVGLLGARILIVDVVLSPAEVIGAVAALAVWIGLLSRMRSRAVWLAALFAGVIVAEALEPFRFAAAPHPFGWMPFRGLLQGSLSANVLAFFDKAFKYGAFLWLLERAGCRWGAAAVLGGALVFALRLVQTWIPGRSAEIADLLLLLMLAGVTRLLGGAVGSLMDRGPNPHSACTAFTTEAASQTGDKTYRIDRPALWDHTDVGLSRKRGYVAASDLLAAWIRLAKSSMVKTRPKRRDPAKWSSRD